MGRWSYFIILLSVFACYEPVEDCLDVDARNYNVMADNMCDDCCQLPQINVIFTFRNDGQNFNLGDTLSLPGGPIIVENFFFFLSAFQPNDQNGNPVKLGDSIVVQRNDGNMYISNNFRYFDRANFRSELRSLRFNGKFSSIQFQPGLPSVVNQLPPDTLRTNTGIGNFPNSAAVGTGKGYSFVSVTLRVPDNENTFTLHVFDEYPLQTKIINTDIQVTRGNNVDVNLNLDLFTWLQNIPVKGDESQWKPVLITAFANALSLR